MKKNLLSVWTFPYRKSYYLTHPHLFVREVYWNVRNFWHRGRYGYAYTDVWNMCDHLPILISEMLRYLSEHFHAYPGIAPYETPEKWKEHLIYMSKRFGRHGIHERLEDERNEYKKAFDEMIERTRRVYDDRIAYEGMDSELRDKYFAREREILKADEEYDKETFLIFIKELNMYWD